MKSTTHLIIGVLSLLALFVVTGPAHAQVCVPPPAGLVSWWAGDGNADDIQDGNDGTLQNGATFAAGKVGQAFSFDGVDSVVEIANEANFDFDRTDAFTIDAWVKSTSKAVGNQFIVAKQDLTTAVLGGYVLGIRDQDGDNLVMILQFSGSQFMLVDGTTDIIDGQFHHVAGVYDGSGTAAGIKLFVDGVQEATVVTQDNLGANTILNDAPLTIGTRKDNLFDVDFNGIIDEVEIFDRALSASEIQAIFNAGSAGKCKFPFADFTLKKAKVNFSPLASINDSFKIEGGFTLDAASNGIDPRTEEVVVTVGTSSVSIAPFSFVAVGSKFEFEGVIGGADVEMKIEQTSMDVFEFKVEARGIDLTDTSNPVEITLRIGDDNIGASIMVRLKGKLKLKKGPKK